jgi:hypothetical protein
MVGVPGDSMVRDRILRALKRYTDEEITSLRGLVPISHKLFPSGGVVVSNSDYTWELSRSELYSYPEIIVDDIGDIPLYINNNLPPMIQDIYKWRLKVGR